MVILQSTLCYITVELNGKKQQMNTLQNGHKSEIESFTDNGEKPVYSLGRYQQTVYWQEDSIYISDYVLMDYGIGAVSGGSAPYIRGTFASLQRKFGQ